MIVPYSKFLSKTPGFAAYWRPMLEIKLIGRARSIRAIGTVDSGADNIVLNKDYAAILGIDWTCGLPSHTQGISGPPAAMYLHDIEIEVINLPNSRRKCTVGFVDLPNIDVLLGQIGFFENFVVRFKYDKKIFAIDLP